MFEHRIEETRGRAIAILAIGLVIVAISALASGRATDGVSAEPPTAASTGEPCGALICSFAIY